MSAGPSLKTSDKQTKIGQRRTLQHWSTTCAVKTATCSVPIARAQGCSRQRLPNKQARLYDHELRNGPRRFSCRINDLAPELRPIHRCSGSMSQEQSKGIMVPKTNIMDLVPRLSIAFLVCQALRPSSWYDNQILVRAQRLNCELQAQSSQSRTRTAWERWRHFLQGTERRDTFKKAGCLRDRGIPRNLALLEI